MNSIIDINIQTAVYFNINIDIILKQISNIDILVIYDTSQATPQLCVLYVLALPHMDVDA